MSSVGAAEAGASLAVAATEDEPARCGGTTAPPDLELDVGGARSRATLAVSTSLSSPVTTLPDARFGERTQSPVEVTSVTSSGVAAAVAPNAAQPLPRPLGDVGSGVDVPSRSGATPVPAPPFDCGCTDENAAPVGGPDAVAAAVAVVALPDDDGSSSLRRRRRRTKATMTARAMMAMTTPMAMPMTEPDDGPEDAPPLLDRSLALALAGDEVLDGDAAAAGEAVDVVVTAVGGGGDGELEAAGECDGSTTG